ncbi:MAG TPA: hypothetical protein VH682_31755 [Gemmataceae bacterium]|jgi:hypothetical protein
MTTATPIPVVYPDGIYDDLLLGSVLDLSPQVLANARRMGELRYTRKGKRTLYLGRWVLEWLTADERPEQGR